MKNSRRKFLADSLRALAAIGVSGPAMDIFLTSVWNRAHGATILDSPGVKDSLKFFQIVLAGGMPRWMFDLPLRPAGTDGFAAGGFGNLLDISGNTVNVIHGAWKSPSGYYLPPVWNMSVSGAPAFSTLLPHVAFIRGIDAEINSHSLNRQRLNSPVIGGYSLSGSFSDASINPVAGIHMSGAGDYTFKSRKGNSATQLSASVSSTANPVKTLLTPFTLSGTAGFRKNEEWKLAINQALDQFDLYAKNLGYSKNQMRNDYENADSLIRAGVDSLLNLWQPTYNKYVTIVKSAMQPSLGTLPGIFDKKIFANPSSTDRRLQFQSAMYAKQDDLRNAVTANSSFDSVASLFAAAEIILLTGLSSNVVASVGNASGMQLQNGVGSNYVNDQHFVGSIVSTVFTTLQYRALIGCLSQFVTEMKATNVFDRTMIQIGGEFNRSPKGDASGSDHGVSGSNETLISGKIAQTAVLGNIHVNSGSTTYPGTWGVSAPFNFGSESRPIRYNDVARTITSMMGIEDIVTNGYPLFVANGSTWVPRKKEAKNV